MSRLVKWYTLNMLGLLYINYTSIKMAKIKTLVWRAGGTGLSMEAGGLDAIGLSLLIPASLCVSVEVQGLKLCREIMMSLEGHGHRKRFQCRIWRSTHFPIFD